MNQGYKYRSGTFADHFWHFQHAIFKFYEIFDLQNHIFQPDKIEFS